MIATIATTAALATIVTIATIRRRRNTRPPRFRPPRRSPPQPVRLRPPPDSTTVASTAPVQSDVAAPAPAPVAAAPAPQPAPVAAAPASDPNSPLGVWATEENKGNVRIEQCGANLCGYAVKTGEKILISMKPTGSKWTGRIHDPDSGRNYDSTMALKGSNSLRVQGLRLRRHVLRRPDLEARQLTTSRSSFRAVR